jgi:hypothetical protein
MVMDHKHTVRGQSIAKQMLAKGAFRSNEYAGTNQGVAPELICVYTTTVR